MIPIWENRRAPTHRRWVGVIVLLLGTIDTTLERSFALDDIYLLCKGSITVVSAGVTPMPDQEIAMHIMSDRVNPSGNDYIYSREMQICRRTIDDFYFDSQSCSGRVDLSKPRTFGTFNKVTGKLEIASENHLPNGSIWTTKGKFICKKTEPLIK
jgi:hypothetical protein